MNIFKNVRQTCIFQFYASISGFIYSLLRHMTVYTILDIDIYIGTKHRLVAFKRRLIFYIYRFTLHIHGHTGSQISVLIKIKFIFKEKCLII